MSSSILRIRSDGQRRRDSNSSDDEDRDYHSRKESSRKDKRKVDYSDDEITHGRSSHRKHITKPIEGDEHRDLSRKKVDIDEHERSSERRYNRGQTNRRETPDKETTVSKPTLVEYESDEGDLNYKRERSQKNKRQGEAPEKENRKHQIRSETIYSSDEEEIAHGRPRSYVQQVNRTRIESTDKSKEKHRDSSEEGEIRNDRLGQKETLSKIQGERREQEVITNRRRNDTSGSDSESPNERNNQIKRKRQRSDTSDSGDELAFKRREKKLNEAHIKTHKLRKQKYDAGEEINNERHSQNEMKRQSERYDKGETKNRRRNDSTTSDSDEFDSKSNEVQRKRLRSNSHEQQIRKQTMEEYKAINRRQNIEDSNLNSRQRERMSSERDYERESRDENNSKKYRSFNKEKFEEKEKYQKETPIRSIRNTDWDSEQFQSGGSDGRRPDKNLDRGRIQDDNSSRDTERDRCRRQDDNSRYTERDRGHRQDDNSRDMERDRSRRQDDRDNIRDAERDRSRRQDDNSRDTERDRGRRQDDRDNMRDTERDRSRTQDERDNTRDTERGGRREREEIRENQRVMEQDRRSRRDNEQERHNRREQDRDSRRDTEKERQTKDDGNANDEPSTKKKKAPTDGVEALTMRTGGAYIPPARLKLMQQQITDKNSAAYQRFAWEALKKSINGLTNKVNTSNMSIIVRELLKENIVRGRGVLTRSLVQAQSLSPTFSHVYAAFVSILNTKFPQIGELLLKRLIIQFRRGFRRNDKTICLTATRYLAHLINQQVCHEVLALEILTLLLETPTDDSVEVAVGFLKESGMKLNEVSPRGVHAIFERLRSILHEGQLDKRVQYMIEVMFAIRKDGFKDHVSVAEGLDLVEEADQFTHLITLEEATDPQDILNVFKHDPEYEINEEKYRSIRKEILDESSDSDEDGSDKEGSSGSESEEKEDDTKTIIDSTETNLVALRRTIYLTIQSSLDFEECAHKLLRMELKPGQEVELCHMILDCCAQQRTYEKFFGLLAQRFCHLNKIYIAPFEDIFKDSYDTIHRLETNKLRNVGKFFAHLLFTDAINWTALSHIKLNEDDTTSSSRIFIKILFQELSEYMGLPKLNARVKDPTLQLAFDGLFPRDNPRNTRFAINFFTSIGLGGLTDELRLHLKNQPKAPVVPQVPDSSSSSSSSSDGSSDSSSDDSDSDDESSSSEEEEANKKQKSQNKSSKSDRENRKPEKNRRNDREPEKSPKRANDEQSKGKRTDDGKNPRHEQRRNRDIDESLRDKRKRDKNR